LFNKSSSKKKVFLRRTISISLLFIFLAGHSGFAMATHYCGGLVMATQIVVGHIQLHCGMSNMVKDCDTDVSEKNHNKKKPCCENEYQSLDQEDEFQPQVMYSSISLEFVPDFFNTLIERSYALENDKVAYSNYSPPLIEGDIQVLVQSFLI
jgi:hypothetical protein